MIHFPSFLSGCGGDLSQSEHLKFLAGAWTGSQGKQQRSNCIQTWTGQESFSLSKLWKSLMHSLKKRRQLALSKYINVLPSRQQEFLPSVVTPTVQSSSVVQVLIAPSEQQTETGSQSLSTILPHIPLVKPWKKNYLGSSKSHWPRRSPTPLPALAKHPQSVLHNRHISSSLSLQQTR